MQTCGGDPRGVRVEWRDRGGRTRLVGVTEFSRILGTNPNLALSVLEGLGRWEAGRIAGGMDAQPKAWGRLENRGGGDSSSSSSSTSSSSISTSSGEKTPPPRPPTPPPRPPRKDPAPATSRVATKRRPPPKGSRASPSPRPSRRPRARAEPTPPQTPSPPLATKGPGPLWECAGCGGHPVCPLGGEGQWGDRQPSDGVGGLG